MASSNITKLVLANSLKELLKKYPLHKISVKDITEHCSISRNAFYYHFKDKYDLISWIFYNDMLKNINTFQDPSKLTDSFVQLCIALHQERAFYLNCFQYKGQNSLYEIIYKCYYELWKVNLDMYYQEHSIKICDAQLNVMASLNSHALVGIISDWVKSGMNNNYLSYFEQVQAVLDTEYFPFSTTYADIPETHSGLSARLA